jgi:2-amino-4-hydroxy-6-hydroxymethyldihydropteridine diphosphokinase
MTNDSRIQCPAYIALGSNKGDRFKFLTDSIGLIDETPGCNVIAVSSVYETRPLGNMKQDNFLNAVAKIETSLGPLNLFKEMKRIEKEIGRLGTEKWGPREIDLDLILYDALVYSDNVLTIPHKGLTDRDFVLVPLCEISPEIKHPELKKKICDISIKDSEKCIISKLSHKLVLKTGK